MASDVLPVEIFYIGVSLIWIASDEGGFLFTLGRRWGKGGAEEEIGHAVIKQTLAVELLQLVQMLCKIANRQLTTQSKLLVKYSAWLSAHFSVQNLYSRLLIFDLEFILLNEKYIV